MLGDLLEGTCPIVPQESISFIGWMNAVSKLVGWEQGKVDCEDVFSVIESLLRNTWN